MRVLLDMMLNRNGTVSGPSRTCSGGASPARMPVGSTWTLVLTTLWGRPLIRMLGGVDSLVKLNHIIELNAYLADVIRLGGAVWHRRPAPRCGLLPGPRASCAPY